MHLLAVPRITPLAEQMDVDLLKKGKKELLSLGNVQGGDSVLPFSKLQFPTELR